jgi:Protein of unknown function (DUF4079)
MTSTFGSMVAEQLEPLAAWFRALNVPHEIVHWGHPAMMGIVVAFMGSAAAVTGWKGRLSEDAEVSAKNRGDHRKIAPLMTVFLIMGYTGGVLSLVMQKEDVMASPHFWTGSVVVLLLITNSVISKLFKGEGENPGLRKAHAYIGSGIMALLLVHAAFGLNLGLGLHPAVKAIASSGPL